VPVVGFRFLVREEDWFFVFAWNKAVDVNRDREVEEEGWGRQRARHQLELSRNSVSV
jgi:hypothetical protein